MKKKNLFMTFLYISSVALTAVPLTSMAESNSQAIDSKDKEISALKSKQSEVSQQISSLEDEITAIYDKGIDLNQQKTKLTQSSEKLEKEITELNARIEKRTEAIQNQGRNVQVNGQGSKMLDIVLNSESISDAVGRIQAISNILTANNDLIKQQQEDKSAVETKKSDIQENLKSVEKANEQLSKEKENLIAKQADLNVLKGDIDSQTSSAENSKNTLLKEQQEALKAQKESAAKAEKEKKQAAATEATTAAKVEQVSSESETSVATDSQTTTSSSSNVNESTSNNNSSNQGNTTAPVTPPTVTTPPSNSSDATFQALNALRVAHGLNPVSWSDGLAASAAGRAASMQDYQVPADHWNRGDEVIAFMFAPGNSVIMAWYNETNMTSPSGMGHRNWELNPNMTSVGFGYAGDVIVGHSA